MPNQTFTCSTCHETKAVYSLGNASAPEYGKDDKENIHCWACCSEKERQHMCDTGRRRISVVTNPIRITIPQCPQCGEREYTVTPQELNSAGGYIHCDRCDAPGRPSQNDMNLAAIEVAMDEMLAEGKLARPTSDLMRLALRRDQLITEWMKP